MIFIASRIILIFFIIMAMRYGYLQLIASDSIQEDIIEDRVREIENIPQRGQITDSNNNVLSMSLMTYDIAINPNLILSSNHQERVATLLSDYIDDVSYDEVLEEAENTSYWSQIARYVPADVSRDIRDSGIGGIEVSQSPQRFYPSDSLAGPLLGFVNDNHQPGAGIELYMNEFLEGTSGYTLGEINPYGNIIPVGSQNTVTPRNGYNVQTTIESYTQHLLEERVAEAMDELNASEIHAAIMKPDTGEVVAMSSYPSFDPNEYQDYDESTWTNTPANFTYEPGSIFKPLFMAAGFESGALDGSEIFPTGSTYVNGSRITDWNNGQGWGDQDLDGILENSSNIGMIHIADRMTNQEIVDYLEHIRLDRRTGIELPGEEFGFNFPTVEALDNDPVRVANISFGQGLMMTPVQILNSYSELVNGGHRVDPTLIKEVRDENENLIYEPEQVNEKMYEANTVEHVKGYLETAGEGAMVDGFDGGGKTGTAWFVEDGVYKDGEIIGSFLGHFPQENPEYAMVVSVKEPEGISYGSEAGIPIFHDVMEQVASHQGMEPTVTGNEEGAVTIAEEEPIDVSNYQWETVAHAKRSIQEEHPDASVETEGDGDIINSQQYRYEDGQLIINFEVSPIKEDGVYTIPHLLGKDMEEISERFREVGIEVSTYGTNVIKEQNLEPGPYHQPPELQLWGE